MQGDASNATSCSLPITRRNICRSALDRNHPDSNARSLPQPRLLQTPALFGVFLPLWANVLEATATERAIGTMVALAAIVSGIILFWRHQQFLQAVKNQAAATVPTDSMRQPLLPTTDTTAAPIPNSGIRRLNAGLLSLTGCLMLIGVWLDPRQFRTAFLLIWMAVMLLVFFVFLLAGWDLWIIGRRTREQRLRLLEEKRIFMAQSLHQHLRNPKNQATKSVDQQNGILPESPKPWHDIDPTNS